MYIPPSSIESRERRRHPRFPLRLPVSVVSPPIKQLFSATSKDLNADGMQIETDQILHPFTSVEVICGGCVHASVAAIPGEVRWIQEKGHSVRIGIAFSQKVDWSPIIGTFIRRAESVCPDTHADHQRTLLTDTHLAMETRNVLHETILDELLEDLINPLSSVMGRLDLLSAKLTCTPSPAGTRNMSSWTYEIDRIQNTLVLIAELCKASDRRKRLDVLQENESISLPDLIKTELRTLNLRTPFKKIHQILDLSSGISPVKGNYAEWANAFIILCQIIQMQTAALKKPQLVISLKEMASQTLVLAHNGTAIGFPMEEHPCFMVFKLLQQRHGVAINLLGHLGNQHIVLAIPRRSLMQDTH